MKMLPESQWRVERIPDDSSAVYVSVSENDGYRHWVKVDLSGRREITVIDMNQHDWPVVWRDTL